MAQQNDFHTSSYQRAARQTAAFDAPATAAAGHRCTMYTQQQQTVFFSRLFILIHKRLFFSIDQLRRKRHKVADE